MKKNLILVIFTAAAVAFSLNVRAQIKTYDKCQVSFENAENKDGELSRNCNGVVFSFKPNWAKVGVTIKNNTENEVIVDWNNAVFIRFNKSSGIAFSTDRMITIDNKKDISTIIPSTYIEKEILSKDQMVSSTILPLYDSKAMKKMGVKYRYSVVIPVKIGDNIESNRFDFVVEYTGKK